MENSLSNRTGLLFMLLVFLLVGLGPSLLEGGQDVAAGGDWAAPAAAGQYPAKWGNDPNGLVGGCGLSNSGFRAKSEFVREVGKSLANVTTIVVLDCHLFDGGGGTFVVPCPADTPYTYCLRNQNDGIGDHVYLGVLKQTAATDPNGTYGGCATGAGFQSKGKLVQQAGYQLRNIDSILVIDCHAADGPPGTKRMECPTKPNNLHNLYNVCLLNQDDGLGNHVEVGIVSAKGAGDPNAQYGGCNTGAGFRSKAALVTEAGKSLDKVTSIVVRGCIFPQGPPGTVVVDCPTGSPWSYCLRNADDGLGNTVDVGVGAAP